MTKLETKIMQIAKIRESLVHGNNPELKSSTFTIWYSPRKKQFSGHFLGDGFSAKSLNTLMNMVEKDALKRFNDYNNTAFTDLSEVFDYDDEQSKLAEAMDKIFELQRQIEDIRKTYSI